MFLLFHWNRKMDGIWLQFLICWVYETRFDCSILQKKKHVTDMMTGGFILNQFQVKHEESQFCLICWIFGVYNRICVTFVFWGKCKRNNDLFYDTLHRTHFSRGRVLDWTTGQRSVSSSPDRVDRSHSGFYYDARDRVFMRDSSFQ